ncbi:MAG: SRPBCC family protein, partial [Candidatus Entotheonellia bacterium]
MQHLKAVTKLSDTRSHWVAKGPAGTSVEWDAEIINDQANEWIAWRSLPNADVDHAGSVHFRRAPGGRGTEVKVEMEYRPPAGRVGAAIASLFGTEPSQQMEQDLHHLKQWIEAGEIATTYGQPVGQR